MCGISGLFDPHLASPADQLTGAVVAMTNTLAHRGPDDHGHWCDPSHGVALGHRRLSIVDLSPMGHQPMTSRSGRWVLTFNGEIYNHPEIRTRLAAEGADFRGHSDTEVLVESIDRWGVRAALAAANGMFAIGVWDRAERRLTLARDRMGEKPLYHGWVAGRFAFASELKAFHHVPGFTPTVDREALAHYLERTMVPAPLSMLDGIRKLPPGHLLEIDGAADAAPEPYWSLLSVASVGADAKLDGTPDAHAALVAERLAASIKSRMVADVPVGAFLSGGIDSSLVVALMQQQSSRPVRTFTVGFDAEGYDEAAHARAVAHHLGTDHTELYLRPSDALDVIPSLADIYDEPFADSSQLPTYLVSAMARDAVTVSLSGDGGDELFAGYARYQVFRSTWNRMRRVPGPARRAAAATIRRVPASQLNRWITRLERVTPARLRLSRPGDKLHKLALLADVADERDAYEILMTQRLAPRLLRDRIVRPERVPWLAGDELVRSAQLQDQLSYLPDDILVKVDRASMARSLEVRVPMLDHELVELSWRLPTSTLFADGSGKWPLRRVLADYVPAAIMDRPKMGFAVPIADWLRGPLRPWAEELLSERRVSDAGLLDATRVRALWAEHLTRAGDWHGTYDLWSVLMLQDWLRRWT